MKGLFTLTRRIGHHASMTLPLFLALSGLFGITAAMFSPPSHSSPPPAPFEAEIRAYEEADRKAPPPDGAVLFIGSSSIRMWETLEEDFPCLPVLNRGFGGSEIEDSIRFIDRIVATYRPRQIVLYAGDNDLANGKTPERVFEDYRRFVREVRRRLPEARIAFIAIKPSPSRWHLVSQIRAANEKIRCYAKADKKLDYIDVFTPMLGADGKPRPELYADDRLHLSKDGYALWKSVTAPYLR